MIRRFAPLIVISVVAVGWLAFAYPSQLGVIVNKSYSLSMGALIGYLIDRFAFPYGRPHQFLSGADGESALGATNRISAFNMATIRRAIIVGSCVLGMALAL